MEFVTIFLEKFWLKYKSIPFAATIAIIVVLLNTPSNGVPFDARFWILCALMSGTFLFYLFETINANKLPAAKKHNTGILFIISAEDRKAIDHVRHCLVLKFEELSSRYESLHTQIICIPQTLCSAETFSDPTEMQSLLLKTNCLFAVRTVYTVDDVNAAENFEMCIEYGLLHPVLSGDVKELLIREMNLFSASIKVQRFKKRNAIETFDVTAKRLSVICEYFLGVSCLLEKNLEVAKRIFIQVIGVAAGMQPSSKFSGMLDSISRIRVVEACFGLSYCAYALYRQTKDQKCLLEYRQLLEEANKFQPDTYGYYLDSAMLAILLDRDPVKAASLIEKCKAKKIGTEWKYSDAFLTAYDNNMNPLKIYRKYQQALKTEMNILAIAEFIEDYLDEDPEHGGLHLALGLIYHEIGDTILMWQHFAKYKVWLQSIGKESGVVYEIDKMQLELPCAKKQTCKNDCLTCTIETAS